MAQDRNLESRVTKLEARMDNMASDITEIKTNHLVHLDAKVDGLRDSIVELKIGMKDVMVRLSIIIGAIATAAQFILGIIEKKI